MMFVSQNRYLLFALSIGLLSQPQGINAQQVPVETNVAPAANAAGQQAAGQQAGDGAGNPTPPNFRYWNTRWSFRDLALDDLAGKLRRIGLELPVGIAGTADVDFDVAVPWNALGTGKAYRISGKLTITDLVVDQVRFESCFADVNLADGRLVLRQLQLLERIDPAGNTIDGSGSIIGNASAELLPRGAFEATVQTKDIAIGPISDLLTRLGLSSIDSPVGGAVNADVSVSGHVDDISRPQRWTIAGDVHAMGIQRSDSLSVNVDMEAFRWNRSELNIDQFRITSPQRPDFFVAATANVLFAAQTRMRASLQINDAPLDDLLGISIDDPKSIVDGKLDAQGDFTAELDAKGVFESLNVDLAIASPAVSIGGVQMGLLEHDLRVTRDHLSLVPRESDRNPAADRLIIRSLDANYQITELTFRFSDLVADLFTGQITGSGQFSRTDQADHQLDIHWDHVRPRISLPIPTIGRPVLSAVSSGMLTWSAPAAKWMQPSEHNGSASFSIDQIEIAGEAIGRADVAARLDQTLLSFTVTGQVLGGTLRVHSTAPLDATTRWNDLPARFQIEQFELVDLSVNHMFRGSGSNPLRISTRASVALIPTTIDLTNGNADAELRLDAMSVNGILISPSLRAQIAWLGDELWIKSVAGTYAGGQLELDGRWSSVKGVRLITARLTHADGNRILLPVHSRASDWVGGKVSGRATITGGSGGILDDLRITGSVNVDQGTAFGIPIGDAHSPMELVLATNPIQWRVSFPAIRSKLARGRVSGDLLIASSSGGRTGIHMDSHWRINHVDFESLLSSTLGTSTIGRGDLTGTFRMNGRHIQDVKDLEGRFQLRLGGTDASAVPGLSTAGSLFGATSLVGVRFEQGEAVGRVNKGNLLLERIELASDRVGVQASGRVGLLDQRMDIDAVIKTGNFQGQNVFLQRFGSQSLREFVPLGKLNQTLSERTIVFEMVGPARAPVVRLLSGETLRANARRIAIDEAMGFVIADSLLID